MIYGACCTQQTALLRVKREEKVFVFPRDTFRTCADGAAAPMGGVAHGYVSKNTSSTTRTLPRLFDRTEWCSRRMLLVSVTAIPRSPTRPTRCRNLPAPSKRAKTR